ncbi:MAG: aldolase/citrate lyase family protein [Pseudomonadota bacterium]|nr:aldolase/citrate lyase family protein [Pseudomonadota bacterium]
MELRRNAFKHAIARGQRQIGLWCALPSAYAAEALAGAGFDWLVFDTEHSPGDPLTVLPQLQAVHGYDVSAVARVVTNDVALIKRMLDIGAQSLLVPYVQNAAEAQAAVDAIRYPPLGVRGVAGAVRASNFGRVRDYIERAEEELCLLVQVETRSALDEIEAIAAIDGVDGIFIGPADLAASMGHPGDAGHREVIAAIEDAIRRIKAAGKPPGILTTDRAFARRCLDLGAVFVAVGIDMSVLVGNAEKLAAEFKAD